VARVTLGEPSAWVDLVYHLLANLPLTGGDASNLWHPGYLRFAAEHWPKTGERGLQPMELLALTQLYQSDPDAHRLHAFHREYADIAALTAVVQTPDDNPLRDLFRIGLWGQARAGFEALWEVAFVPRYALHREAMQQALDEAAALVPELAQVRVVPSLPLTHHGRLVGDDVYIGLPEFGVSLEQVQLQAAHEAVLSGVERPAAKPSPRQADGGYDAHWEMEMAALSGLSRRLFGTALGEAHQRWLQRVDAAAFARHHGTEAPEEPATLQAWLAER